ncbi:tail fiber protein [Pelagibacter phage HTVC168P]|nr:tail fiber protein [Pelagibacter phage HTVC168P]
MANSFVRYTGNGTTTTYAIPFSYRSEDDLSATVAGVNITAYTLDAAGTNLTFTTAPANGAAIEIRRTTSQSTKLVDYVSGAVLTENDLDTDSDQAFFMSQEAIDNANDVISLDNADFQWDTQNKRLKNVANPTDNQDAVTKYYLENTWLSPANKTALTTVNDNISNINAVNSNASNINSAVSNATNINTVATNITSVNTVADDITKVIAVANDLAEAVSEVETVADDLNEATSEIDTVATNITNVNNVGNNISNVNTVAGISSNVTTVAGNNANVSTVAGISSNVTTVAGISSDVTSVANDATDIGTVATDISNVNTVAGISGNVTTVAGISSNVTSVANNSSNINSVAGNATNINTVAGNNSNISTVAGVSSNVTTVAGISSDVTAVAGDATDIGTVATDLAGSDNIGTVAGSISNVNAVGGSITNVNTVASNISGVNSFGERYRVSSSAPSTSLDIGDLYFDTTANELKVYKSSGWANAGSTVNGTSERFNYTATGGQTTFTGSDNNGNTLGYDAGFIDVYLNGSKLLNGTDVTVTSGTSVVLASGATAGDVIDIVTYGTFSVATLNADNLSSGTVPDARITGTYTGITGLDLTDNSKIRLGTGNDLEIFHNGTNSIIENKTGDLILRTPDAESIFLRDAGGNNLAQFNDNSGVNLYHNASVKLATTSTGVDVTGDLTVDTNTLYVDSTNNRVGIGTTSPGYNLVVKNNSGTSTIRVESSDNYRIDIQATSGTGTIRTTGSYPLVLNTNQTERMRIDSSGNVGIGTSSPSNPLEIAGSGTPININSTNDEVKKIQFENSGTAVGYIGSSSGTPFRLLNGSGTEHMRIDSSGRVGIGVTNLNRNLAIGTLGTKTDTGTKYVMNIGQTSESSSHAGLGVYFVGHASASNRKWKFQPVENGVANDGIIEFNPDGGRFRANNGIQLGGNTDANKLDDYEEGTWTPTINSVSGFTNTNVDFDYNTYTKIGNLVNIRTHIQFPNSSGNVSVGDFAYIRGLPFAPSVQDNTMMNAYRYNNSNNASAFVTTATTTNEVRWVVSFVNGSPLRNGGRVSVNFFYRTDA